MSITIFIQGRKGVKRQELGRRWLFLPAFILLTVTGVYQYTVERFGKQQDRLHNERLARISQQQQVENLKEATQSQLATLTAHVARMQAKMSRLEALGQQVAFNYDLEDQFNFSSEVGVGGADGVGQGIELDQLIREMDQLVKRIDNNNLELPLLETVASNLNIDEERYISGRPILKGWLSSPYGLRNDPFSGRRSMHKGIDFAGSEGADVIATAGGVVTWAGSMFGYGNLVEIDHGNGFRTRYGHNKSLSVSVGEVIAKDTKIASMGSTGRSTGPHVHYEVLRNGHQIDPRKYVYRNTN